MFEYRQSLKITHPVREPNELWPKCIMGRAFCEFKLGDCSYAENLFDLGTSYLLFSGCVWVQISFTLFECEMLYSTGSNFTASAKLYTAQLTYNRQMESAKSESTSMLVWTRILGVKFRLGLLHEINDAPQTAEKYYLEALEICHENRIFCHPVLFDTNFHLAKIYLKQKKVAECEKFAKKSLEMSLRLFDPNESQVESVFDIFKQLVEYRKNVRKASFVFTSYMDTFSRLGVADQSVFLASFGYTFAKRMFEEIMSEESELKKCRDLFAKSCDVFRKSFGRKDEKTVDSQKMMGLCHLRLGNVRLAEWHLFNAAVALQN